VGTIVAFVACLGRLYGPASALVNVHVDLTTAAGLFERIFAYLDLARGDRREAGRGPLGRAARAACV
jgi:ATP-binding cassette subfamily B protein